MMNTLAQGPRRAGERGAVLLVSLIVLVVMLISSIALVRSFDTSLASAGNLAFKRDLAQQSERVAQEILLEFRPGGSMAGKAARAANNLALNYSAVVLPSNPQGIPMALLTSGSALPSTVGTDEDIEADGKFFLRYVVDRLCSAAGEDDTLGPDRCTLAEAPPGPGTDATGLIGAENASKVAAGGAGAGQKGAFSAPVIYRLSIRATGPRNTQSFFQTNFSCCEN